MVGELGSPLFWVTMLSLLSALAGPGRSASRPHVSDSFPRSAKVRMLRHTHHHNRKQQASTAQSRGKTSRDKSSRLPKRTGATSAPAETDANAKPRLQ